MTPQRPTASPIGERTALALLFVAPVLFASNILAARATADLIPPVALAFWRWLATFGLLLPLCGRRLWRERQAIRREWRDLLVLGALGMGVCGAFVYVGLDTTTATNTGLIYAASPVLIVLMATFFYGEAMTALQGVGIVLSLAGVVLIVCRADPAVLLGLRLTIGDLWIVTSTICWSVYSVMLSHRPSALDPVGRLAMMCVTGVLVLLPFHVWEAWAGEVPSLDLVTVGTVAFIAVVASFGAFLLHTIIQRALGAGRTGLMFYLLPVYNSALASLLLGEALRFYHLVGVGMILPGIFLATRRPGRAGAS